MRLVPQSGGDGERFDIQALPPIQLGRGAVELTMVSTAERNGVFVADFGPQCWRLGKAQMMRIGWLPAADQAGLLGDEL